MKRGRRPLSADDASVRVSFRLPAKQFDLSQKQAEASRVTLAVWLRRAVDRACRRPGPKANG